MAERVEVATLCSGVECPDATDSKALSQHSQQQGSRPTFPAEVDCPDAPGRLALSPHSDTRLAERGEKDSALHMVDDAKAVVNKHGLMEEEREADRGMKRACDACVANKARVFKKHRVKGDSSHLLLETVHLYDGQPIICISVPNKSSTSFETPQHAIALWPQYWITWKGKEFHAHPWLFFHRHEDWVKNMLVAAQPVSGRQSGDRASAASAVQHFVASVRTQICHAIEVVRQPFWNQTDSELEAEADMFVKSAAMPQSSLLEIKIWGYPVRVLNHKHTLAMCMDENCVEFVKHVLVPLAAKSWCERCLRRVQSWEDFSCICRNRSDNLRYDDLSQQSPVPLPNIVGKVTWSGWKQAWEIQVRNSLEEEIPDFPIGFAFEDSLQQFIAKLRQYRCAIAAWNRLDSSGRHRISDHRNLWHLYPRTHESHNQRPFFEENEMVDLPCSQSSSVSSMESA